MKPFQVIGSLGNTIKLTCILHIMLVIFMHDKISVNYTDRMIKEENMIRRRLFRYAVYRNMFLSFILLGGHDCPRNRRPVHDVLLEHREGGRENIRVDAEAEQRRIQRHPRPGV